MKFSPNFIIWLKIMAQVVLNSGNKVRLIQSGDGLLSLNGLRERICSLENFLHVITL